MAAAFVFVLALALAGSNAEPERIIGGSNTVIEQYPSLVQVERWTTYFVTHYCTANIISNLYLLTAAQCFSGPSMITGAIIFRAGASLTGMYGLTFGMNRYINHPSFSSNNQRYVGDISLIRLSRALTFRETIQPVGIVPQGFQLIDGLAVVQAGWGYSNPTTSSPRLRRVQTYTINRDLCRQRVPSGLNVTENMICSGIIDEGGRGHCQYDTGGPLYFEGVLAGIISWGGDCRQSSASGWIVPDVNTAVSSYTDWIIATAV